MAPVKSSGAAALAPKDVVSAMDIIDEKHKPGHFVNVVGMVQRALSPMLTRSQQWKIEMEIFDLSIEHDVGFSLFYSIFNANKDVFPELQRGDVVVLHKAKIQSYGGSLSLLHNFQTSVYVFAADQMPSANLDPTPALRKTGLSSARPLSTEYLRYVSAFFHNVSKERLPSAQDFESVKIQSVAIKDKFMELKDVKDSQFCNLTVNIVKEPYDNGDKMTLWVSDFTANPNFYNYAYDPLANMTSENPDGDEFGYMNKFSCGTATSGSSWTGPYGQRSIQITCWGYHADNVRHYKLRQGSWVHLKNIHIKFGHNGGNLEGYLREDEEAREKHRIHPLDPSVSGDGLEPRLKEALRRKRDYEKEKKSNLKAVEAAALAGQKRKSSAMGSSAADGKKSTNRKQKRAQDPKIKAKKEAIEAAAKAAEDAESRPQILLNPAVKFESHDYPPSCVDEITSEKTFEMEEDGNTITLKAPFLNASYRGHFRITDFKPDRLRDFAAQKMASDEFAALSDNDDSGNDSDSDAARSNIGSQPGESTGFEWRFAVKLEDAQVPGGQEKKAFWALVNNQSGQYLTNLDAVNLRRDEETLKQLRETMFLLWGDLEEKKSRITNEQDAKAARARDGQPPDSSHPDLDESPRLDEASNLPFGCCILEYGVKVAEEDDAKADAGLGYRWQRLFRLERTRIAKE